MEIIKVAKALGDPTRLEIFEMLKNKNDNCSQDIDEWACICIFQKHFNMTQPTLTYHMKILEEAQLICSTKKGKYTLYTINKETILEVMKYFEVIYEK